MNQGSDHLDRVIDLLSKMPGVGKKSAQRMAYRILELPNEYAFELSESIRALKEKLRYCSRCFNFSSAELCLLCADTRRDPSLLCVVEDASSIKNIERSARYLGLYHVLQGVLSPMHGIGPKELRYDELLDRVAQGSYDEVILALNPTVEGEATASFLAESLKLRNVKVTRIATGIPMGGSLDYCDDVTMASAMDNRRPMN